MTERGKAISTEKKSFKCPYCQKDSASLFHPTGSSNEMFKCFSTHCASQTHGKGAAWDEVKFLAYEMGISERDAAIVYLKEAGVWREQERTSSSVMPGSRARKNKLPQPPAQEPAKPETSKSEPVESKEPAKTEQKTEPQNVIHLPKENPVKPPEEIEQELQKETNEAFTPIETNEGGILGRMILEEFFLELVLSGADEETLFRKRGLTTATARALGFVSSPKSNEQILLRLGTKHPWDECSASGLWLPEDKEKKRVRRPNSQFYGFGVKGKKPKTDRRDKRDRWIWGMTHPVLIPYFDEAGKIFKLRPHKGGAPANTLCGASRIYVPRDYHRAADIAECFPKVVICEGEFKAAALWQMLGAGRDDGGEPIGVCAIPGINFGNNYDLREELEAWLKSVQCRQVTVAFDDQDKSDKPLRERHEAIIWSRYLATSLARKLFITGKVCVLPKTWRDQTGKADWDGALAKFVHA